jgi:L-threonylcarbamoyladenylate synthase
MAASDDIVLAAGILRKGGVVAFPTETVYGLGADALNVTAVERIFTLKGRPTQHPLIVHLGAASQLQDWARDIPPSALALAGRFWPGPLTLILKRAAQVPDSVTGGQDTVGLRVPNHPVALELLRCFGSGIAAPSANRFGRISPTTKEHVAAELGKTVDLILDGGPCAVGLESTIVSLVDDAPVILRPGAISPEALAEVLGKKPDVATGHTTLRAPGMLERHYAPQTLTRLVAGEKLYHEVCALLAFGQQVGVLEMARARSVLPTLERGVHRFAMPATPGEYAQHLYACLREADAAHYDILLVERPPVDAAWLAINDRLFRATQKTS